MEVLFSRLFLLSENIMFRPAVSIGLAPIQEAYHAWTIQKNTISISAN